MSDLTDNIKQSITSEFRGYDSSLHLKGNGFAKILQDIDVDTSISDEAIMSKFNIVYNMIALKSRNNRKLSQQFKWLDNSKLRLLKMLYTYAKLLNSVYTVDKSLLDWYKDFFSNKDVDYEVDMTTIETHKKNGFDYIKENDLGFILIEYENSLYTAEIFNNPTLDKSIRDRHIEVSTFGFKGGKLLNETGGTCITYAFNVSAVPFVEENNTSLAVVCNNTICPRWKQCLDTSYNDNAKATYCDVEDCAKCYGFKKADVLRPNELLTLVEAIYYCTLTRESSQGRETSRGIDYEHIPQPQRTDDVTIYFGKPAKKKSLSEIGLVPISNMTTCEDRIPDSHASPREHHRRGGTRREFTRVVNGKEQKVKATTFRETIVNKGYDKTNYTLKERKYKD